MERHRIQRAGDDGAGGRVGRPRRRTASGQQCGEAQRAYRKGRHGANDLN
jgi:hypothetical protein